LTVIWRGKANISPEGGQILDAFHRAGAAQITTRAMRTRLSRTRGARELGGPAAKRSQKDGRCTLEEKARQKAIMATKTRELLDRKHKLVRRWHVSDAASARQPGRGITC